MPETTSSNALRPWVEIARICADLLSQHDNGFIEAGAPEFEQLRLALAKSPLSGWVEEAGYEIHEGPDPEETDRPPAQVFWWTLCRNGWSGCECGGYFRTRERAMGDAVRAMLQDCDIDWNGLKVASVAEEAFTDSFKRLLSTLRSGSTPERRLAN